MIAVTRIDRSTQVGCSSFWYVFSAKVTLDHRHILPRASESTRDRYLI